MKDNKGFTLVELLAVIVILAIIMIIAAPSMTKEIARNEAENKNILNQKIENAAHLYVAKYYVSDLINENYDNIKFTLDDLEQDGLIDLKGKCEGQLDKDIEVKESEEDNNNFIEYDYSSIKDGDCYQ